MSESRVILNLEPLGFSASARKTWESVGTYIESDVEALPPSHVLTKVEVIIIRLNTYVGEKVAKFFPKLKYIVTATTGLDHLDVTWLTQRGITILSLRDEQDFLRGITSTAELTWGLILALIRFIPASSRSVSSGEWDRDRYRGYQLKNKQLGIIGLGRMGTMVAQYATSFGMEVSYFDPHVQNEKYRRLASISELVHISDIVTLHVHLQTSTIDLINRDVINKMKPGCFFINTSRGRLVDELALVRALDEGRIAGIASDVVATELTDFRESVLVDAMNRGKNVIVTPHIGGATWDAMHSCEEFIANKFKSKFTQRCVE